MAINNTSQSLSPSGSSPTNRSPTPTNTTQQSPTAKTAQDKKKERAVQRALESIEHLEIIKAKNAEFLKEQVAGATAAFSTAQTKACYIVVQDNMRSLFNLNEYVRVESDTSPGMNRPKGFGFVVSVRGLGSATIADVKYEQAFD
jgi:hypothetical protein